MSREEILEVIKDTELQLSEDCCSIFIPMTKHRITFFNSIERTSFINLINGEIRRWNSLGFNIDLLK